MALYRSFREQGVSSRSPIVDRITEEPVPSKSTQSTVTSIYQVNMVGYWRNVTILWTKNYMNHSLHLIVDALRGEIQYNCKIDVKPWHFLIKKGYKSFIVDGHQVEVYWDLRSAKFSGSPEPYSHYYVAVVYDEEIVLLLGDCKKKAYKRTKANTTCKCRMGLVEEGNHYFNSMVKDFGLTLANENFACTVYLLGRVGLLDQANNLIEGMPLKPNAAVWGALLGACRIHHDSRLAETAVKNLTELNAEDSRDYVLLENIYTNSGELEGLAYMRKATKERGIRKSPGWSWTKVDNRVHGFIVDDTNDLYVKEIYIKLEEMMKKIEDSGRYICTVDSLGAGSTIVKSLLLSSA